MTEQKERELYFWLRLIREFEDRISALDRQGKIQGGVYSGKGQEAVVVGVCHDLRPDDWIFPLHRDLGAFLVKGADPNRLMAQIFGRRDGFSKGKDSFLHGGDFSRCIFGATSMLGSTLPVAVGTAYKFKIKREDRVAIAFFGEGASSRGDVHEAMNFAGIYKLPVVFLCENNFYAYSTPNELQFAVEDVADRAVGYGFKGEVCSGNDLHSVMKAARKAIATRSSFPILNLYAVPAATGSVEPSIDVAPKMHREKSPPWRKESFPLEKPSRLPKIWAISRFGSAPLTRKAPRSRCSGKIQSSGRSPWQIPTTTASCPFPE